MKRVIALLLAMILFTGILPIDAAATEQEFVNVQLILDGKLRQYKVIESGSELMFSGEDLAAMGGYEYRIEQGSAYFTRGMKTLRVDLEASRLYPFEDIALISKINMAEKVREVDGVYYFPGSEILPWLNVVCFVIDGQLNICKDEVSIWEIIPVFAPEEFEFDFTACCKELGVNGKYLKARAYLQDEGLTGMFFDIIPVVGDTLDYYDLFEDIVQDQSAAEEETEDLLEDSEDVSYWMEIAEDFEVIEDLPDELRLFGEVANFLSNNAVSFSFEMATYVKNFSLNHENILAAFRSMDLNSGIYEIQLPWAAESALMDIQKNYSDYYAGIEYKMVRAIGETAFEGLTSVPSGLYQAAIKLVGFTEATAPDWAEGINRISSYDTIAEYCIRTYEEMTDHTWMSSIKDMCGLAYMYLYSCEQNWNAMADYAIKEGKLDLAAEYRAMAESTEEWQRKFMEAVPAAMNDSHEYEVVDGSMKQGYTDKLTRMFGDVEKQPDLLSQEEKYIDFLQDYPEYSYYSMLDINGDGIFEMLATDGVNNDYTSSYNSVDLFVLKNDSISLVCEDIWSKYKNLTFDTTNRWLHCGTGGTGVAGFEIVYLDDDLTVQRIAIDYYWIDDNTTHIFYNGEEITNRDFEPYEQIVNKQKSETPEDVLFKFIPKIAPSSESGYSHSYRLGMPSYYDLDGDSTYEKVSVTEHDCVTIIKINDTPYEFDAYWAYPTGYYSIINVDSSEDGLLIAVSDYGTSDDPMTFLYEWTGSNVVEVGVFDDLLGKNELNWSVAICNGDGTISITTRSDILGTWGAKATISVDNSTITDITDFYTFADFYEYSIGRSFTTKCDVIMYNNKEDLDSQVIVPAGTIVYMTGHQHPEEEQTWVAFKLNEFEDTMWLCLYTMDWPNSIETSEGLIDEFSALDGIYYAG